ncbi:MAG: hypothetical protein ACKVLD_05135 [Flavobacteriales bacterium]|tara:strand:+ start:4080 stop:5273 length:1194 start_codon:yes stop_codon:yes gene_type:complete
MSNFFLSFRKHFSFVIIAFGSLCFFLVNFLLKDYLSQDNYGTYSIFITYISLLSSFGMLGFEQTLIRTSKIKQKLEIEKSVILPSVISVFFVSIVGSYLIINNYEIGLDYYYLLTLSTLVILTKLVFNLSRMMSKFIFSQLSLNFWKIGLFLITLYLVFFEIKIKILDLFQYVLILFFVSGILIFPLFKQIVVVHEKKIIALIKQSLLFFLTLFTISLISFGDRFFIENRFGLSEMGNYFFYINIFLFPFMLFQNYIGFKEIIVFKKDFSQKMLNDKIVLAQKYSLCFSIVLIISLCLIEYLNIYDLQILLNLDIIIPLIILGNIKVIYSLLSSAVGAVANDKMLIDINIKSIFSIFLIMPCIYYFAFNISITIFFIITLWLIRSLIWYKQLLKYEN